MLNNKGKHITLYLGICVSIAFILSSTSAYVDPRKLIWLSFLGLAFPILFVLQTLVAALALFRKKWILFITLTLLLSISWARIRAHWGGFGYEATPTKNAKTFRIMTYNVHFFNVLSDDKSKNTGKQIQELINQKQPDILCIQEFYFKKKGKYDFKDSILKRTAFKYAYFEPTMNSETETIGMMIFSKFPIRKNGAIYFDQEKKSGNMAIFADILINNKMVRVYNLHLQSLKFKAEDYEFLQKNNNQGNEIQPAKRIAKLIKTGFEKRAEQVDILLSEFQKCHTSYIISGDFNDTPGSNALYRITQNLKNSFTEKGKRWGNTFYAFLLPLQIDYIAHTKDLNTVFYENSSEKFSDHYPVIADIQLP